MEAGSGPFWAYILENRQGRFYVGSTDDLRSRLADHNDPDRARSKYTARHAPWRLVWSEVHSTRASAMRREADIKRKKSAKWIREALLNW